MGKIFGILVIVAGIWVGLEVFTEGIDGAFGGLFREPAGAEEPAPVERLDRRTVPQRVGDRVNSIFRADEERKHQMLGEP